MFAGERSNGSYSVNQSHRISVLCDKKVLDMVHGVLCQAALKIQLVSASVFFS